MVQGMVYGYVVAVGVVIDQGGQVWGDICTTAVDMRPGSKLVIARHAAKDVAVSKQEAPGLDRLD